MDIFVTRDTVNADHDHVSILYLCVSVFVVQDEGVPRGGGGGRVVVVLVLAQPPAAGGGGGGVTRVRGVRPRPLVGGAAQRGLGRVGVPGLGEQPVQVVDVGHGLHISNIDIVVDT